MKRLTEIKEQGLDTILELLNGFEGEPVLEREELPRVLLKFVAVVIPAAILILTLAYMLAWLVVS